MSDALWVTAGKRELRLERRLLNAAGTLGFSDEAKPLVEIARLAAFVTHPVSSTPRSPAKDAGVRRAEGNVLLHSGLPNPGLSTVIRRNRHRWRALPCPLIVHIFDPSPQGIERMLLRLEAEPAVSAVEVGLEAIDAPQVQAFARVLAASELPAILRLPLDCPPEAFLQAAEAGAPAISIGPPRGSLLDDQHRLVSGRMYGPGLFPLAHDKVRQLAPALTVPLIAAGGASHPNRAQALMDAGASAVMLDTILWTNPSQVV